MIKVAQYIETTGTQKFRDFIKQPFTIDMLYPVFNEKSCETLFDGWRGKDMLSWHKFTNDENIVLEFYVGYYIIKKKGESTGYQLMIPENIDDFINDMRRFGVQLFWTIWIDENFEPKDYLDKNEIRRYYEDLLRRMGKSHELQ